MRKVIYAINFTLDGCFDHTNGVPGVEVLNITHTSYETLTCSCLGVKPMNSWFLIGRISPKAILRQKQRTNLLTHLTPRTRLFSHDH